MRRVAPMGVHLNQNWNAISTKALLVYGSLDKGGEKTTEYLSKMPNSLVYKMEGAHHACYLDDPVGFHENLLVFLESLA